MRIGVISDTHDKLSTIDAAIAYFVDQSVDQVVHCGDWKSPSTLKYFLTKIAAHTIPVTGVIGNNDVAVDEFQEIMRVSSSSATIAEGVVEFTADNKCCAVYHGHHRPTLRAVRENDAYDIIFLGHTHKPLIEIYENKLIINPGSTAFSIPRSKLWRPTVAIIDTKTMYATIADIDY